MDAVSLSAGVEDASVRPCARTVKFLGDEPPDQQPCSPLASRHRSLSQPLPDDLKTPNGRLCRGLLWTSAAGEHVRPTFPISAQATRWRCELARASPNGDAPNGDDHLHATTQGQPTSTVHGRWPRKRFESRSKSWGAGLNIRTEEFSLANGRPAEGVATAFGQSAVSASLASDPPALYEFSLVEDLATGSSIYQHKYSEKLAAMDIRKSIFLSRLLSTILGPLWLSIPLVGEAMRQLLDWEEASCHKWCKRVEAIFSVLLIAVFVCSTLLLDDWRLAGEGVKMVGFYGIVAVMHAAIHSPDRVGQYAPEGEGERVSGDALPEPAAQGQMPCLRRPSELIRHESSVGVQLEGGLVAKQLAPGRLEEEGSSSDSEWEWSGADYITSGPRTCPPRSSTSPSPSSGNGRMAASNCVGRDGAVADSAGVTPEVGGSVISKGRGRSGDGGARGRRSRDDAGLGVKKMGPGKVAGSRGMSESASGEPRVGEGARDVLFTELQERWQHMQRAEVQVFDARRRPQRTSLHDLSQKVFGARAIGESKIARQRARLFTGKGLRIVVDSLLFCLRTRRRPYTPHPPPPTLHATLQIRPTNVHGGRKARACRQGRGEGRQGLLPKLWWSACGSKTPCWATFLAVVACCMPAQRHWRQPRPRLHVACSSRLTAVLIEILIQG